MPGWRCRDCRAALSRRSFSRAVSSPAAAASTAPGGGDREGDREHPVPKPGLQVPEPALEGGGLVLVSPAANPRNPLPDLPHGQHGDVQQAWGRGRDSAGYACRRHGTERAPRHVKVPCQAALQHLLGGMRPGRSLTGIAGRLTVQLASGRRLRTQRRSSGPFVLHVVQDELRPEGARP